MIRVETSFQDTPGGGYYFALSHNGRLLADQLEALGLHDGDTVILWEPGCDYETEAVLLVDFQHPAMLRPALWAREKPSG